MHPSDSQKSAIMHNRGAMMVLAGPGSGKTFVVTNRVRELVESYGADPAEILVITFTKAAAVEMKERFLRLCQKTSTAVNFGTFHAVFFKIIKYAYSYDASNVLSEDERYMYLRDLVYSLELDVRDEKDFIAQIGSEISLIKSSELSVEHYYSQNCSAEDFVKLYSGYEARLRVEKKIDFDDMLIICYELLSARRDILSFWQSRFKYVLIDEFQDINLLQYKIIKMLAEPENNIFVVGDDDQSIYGFRGAKPQIMKQFERDYPGVRVVTLDVNYRCAPEITEAASKLISVNRTRYEKKLQSGADYDGFVSIYNFKNQSEEYQFVARRILDLVTKGTPIDRIAVLYRLNSQPGGIVYFLNEYNLKFRLSDRLPDIFEHWIARDILAYLELAAGSRNRRHFIQIANHPKRYISRNIFTKEEMSFYELEQAVWDKPYVIKALDKLRYDLDFMAHLDPFATVHYIRNAVGYDDYLREYAEYRGINESELTDVLEELTEHMRGFANLSGLKAYIEEYREKLEKSADSRSRNASAEVPAINLMTFHGAKGLEFDAVFIIDANEGFAPYAKAGVTEDLEEERRMFYVAMTRARKRLYILSSNERYSRSLEVSRFVEEIRKED